MFLFTVTKPGLRQAGALALCAVCLCGTVAAAVHFSGDAVAAAAPVTATVETTQDIGTYFTGYGFETDLSSAAVDKVKIPKKWDDSFTAFNQIVQESGLDLADYKGKTVEKWTVLCPQLSTGDHDTYCVLLVYKAKAVGAYLLERPSGVVVGLKDMQAAMAEAEAKQTSGEDYEGDWGERHDEELTGSEPAQQTSGEDYSGDWGERHDEELTAQQTSGEPDAVPQAVPYTELPLDAEGYPVE